ncbi:MAG: acetate--CoA ligase family protein [Candidatus Methanofastidiosia archaeon]
MNKLINLETFFNPRTIAIIGASDKKGTIGNVIMDNTLRRGFKGTVYPVTHSSKSVMGKKAYPSILDIKDDIDLAVIAIHAKAVNSVIKDCVHKNVKSCIIITGGFSEIGEYEREKKLKDIINNTKTRIVGPNCIGVFDSYSNLDTIFLPEDRMRRPLPGKIGLISQSGAFVAAMLDWAASENIGMSKVVSFGNKIDVNYSDLVQYLAQDDSTSVITIYMEGLEYGRMFMEAASKATLHKPIIILKSGRSVAGAVAAASHTGSLAGSDAVYSAAFKQSGIIRSYSSDELFDMAKIFTCHKEPEGDQIAIITNGGGAGVMATDALEDEGLKLADINDKAKHVMEEHFPPYCSLKNPIDLTGDANVERYEIALREVLNEGCVDAVLLILLFQAPTLEDDGVKRIININKDTKKPIIIVAPGGTYTKDKIKELEKAGIPCYQTPERGVRALAALCNYYKHRRRKQSV